MPQQRKRRLGTGFEQLEDRRMNAVTVGLVENALVIAGDDQANSVTIERHEYTRPITGGLGLVVGYEEVNDLWVGVDGAYQRFAAGDVAKIQADLKGGDDFLAFTDSGLPSHFRERLDKPAAFALGDGNDHCIIRFDQVDRAARAVEVDAGDGNDRLLAQFGNIQEGDFTATASMGGGADTAEIEVLGDLRGAALFQFWGEAGNDDLTLLAGQSDNSPYESWHEMGIDRSSKLSAQFNGGTGDDNLGFAYRGWLEGRIDLQFSGGSGHDAAWIDLDLQSRSAGSLHARIWNVDNDDWLVHWHNSNSQAKVVIDEVTPFARMRMPPQQKLAPTVPPTAPLPGTLRTPAASTPSPSVTQAAATPEPGLHAAGTRGLLGGLRL